MKNKKWLLVISLIVFSILVLLIAAFFYLRYREDSKLKEIALDYQKSYSNYNIEDFDECLSSYLKKFELNGTVTASEYVRASEEIAEESKCITTQVDDFYLWYETQLVKMEGLNCSMTSHKDECIKLTEDFAFVTSSIDDSDFNKMMRKDTDMRVDFNLCVADVFIVHVDSKGYFLDGHNQEQLDNDIESKCAKLLEDSVGKVTNETEDENEEETGEQVEDEYYDFSDTPIGETLEEIRKVTKLLAYQ